ncbi:MAG: hypothetical protein ACFFCQ_05700, partial [Promethearchaeota archaeon]
MASLGCHPFWIMRESISIEFAIALISNFLKQFSDGFVIFFMLVITLSFGFFFVLFVTVTTVEFVKVILNSRF